MRKATTCEDCKQTFQSKKLWSEHKRDRKCIKVAAERIEEDVVLIDDDLPEDNTAKPNIPLINEPLHPYNRYELDDECDPTMDYQQQTLYKSRSDCEKCEP